VTTFINRYRIDLNIGRRGLRLRVTMTAAMGTNIHPLGVGTGTGSKVFSRVEAIATPPDPLLPDSTEISSVIESEIWLGKFSKSALYRIVLYRRGLFDRHRMCS